MAARKARVKKAAEGEDVRFLQPKQPKDLPYVLSNPATNKAALQAARMDSPVWVTGESGLSRPLELFTVPNNTKIQQASEKTYWVPAGLWAVAKYPSYSSFVEEARDRRVNNHSASQSSRTGDFSFTGTYNMKDAINLSQDGWKEGARSIRKLSSALFQKMSSLVKVPELRYRDDTGIDFDVARYLDGEEDYWIDYSETTKVGRGSGLVRIVANVCVSAGISKQTIEARGAAIASLANLLDYAGHAVQIEICSATSSQYGMNSEEGDYMNRRFESRVMIKRADEYLDPLTVAMAVAHPSTLRRFHFALMEGLSTDWARSQSVGSGYGSVSETYDPGDVYLPGAVYGDVRWENAEETEKWVMQTLKLQGIELTVEV